jgi:CHRD domain
MSISRILLASAVAAASGLGDSGSRHVSTRLSGLQETPAVSTTASGEFRGRINNSETELAYELEYSGLEGTVTQAHIHFGQKSVAGGIMIWLCGTATNPGPAGTPVCPQTGKVTGTVTAASVIGPAGQGIAVGEFVEALRAIRRGIAYANVHSSKYAAGEIRGQIDDGDDR